MSNDCRAIWKPGAKPVAAVTVFGGSLAVQLSGTLAVGLFHDFAPTELGAIRVLVAGVFLLLAVRPARGALHSPSLSSVALGATIALQVTLHYEAIARIPIASAVALGLIGPIAVAVLTSRRVRDLLPVTGVALGLVLLVGSPHVSSRAGVLFELASSAAVALYVILIMRVGRESVGLEGLAVGVGAAALLLSPLAVRGLIRMPAALVCAKLVAIGVLSAAPYAAELSATRVLPVGIVGVLICADPVAAALFGLAVLHQSIGLQEAAGIVCIMLAAASAVGLAGDVSAR